jgi:cyclic-di-GMP phosphodiesterase TipF (flagellum assembly factor)
MFNIKNTVVLVGLVVISIVGQSLIGSAELFNTYGHYTLGIAIFLILSVVFIFIKLASLKKNADEHLADLSHRMRVMAQLVEGHNEVLSKVKHRTEEGDSQRVDLVGEMKILQTLLLQIATAKNKANTSSQVIEEEAQTKDAASSPQLTDVAITTIMENALKENRVDLYLQPIVNLPPRQHVHYECFTRVRDEQGETIFAKDYMPFAEKTGATSALDNLLLFRVTQIVRKLAHRRPQVKFFCNMSSSSLNDEEFFPQFADFLLSNESLSERLVFEFAQEDVVNMTPQLEKNLLALGQKGYRYSMDKVAELNFDIAALSQKYFRYLKVDGSVFLKGDSVLHPEDLKEALERQEIILIASKIEDERTVVNILDCNVDFGQGFLFGEPKLSTQAMDNEK